MKPHHSGRILRVKPGFNPNSSSMGSIIFALPVSLLAATAGFTVISGLIFQYFVRRPEEKPPHPDEAPPDAVDSDTQET